MKSLVLIQPIIESQNEYNDEFLKYNKNQNDDSIQDEDVQKILINAIKNDNFLQIKELFDQYENIDINKLDSDGKNLLHYACLSNNPEISRMFIDMKCDTKILTKEQWSPLQLAAHKGREEGTWFY